MKNNFLVILLLLAACASDSHIVHPGLSSKDILTMQQNIEYLNARLQEQQRALDSLKMVTDRIEIIDNPPADPIIRAKRRDWEKRK